MGSTNANQWIEVNLNNTAWFRLNEAAAKVVNEEEEKYAEHGVDCPKCKAGDYWCGQLWVAMQLFGPELSMGFTPPVETTFRLKVEGRPVVHSGDPTTPGA